MESPGHRFVLAIGGARSGKSGFAEALAARSGRPVVYVATARHYDDPEMVARIRAHKSARPGHWQTLEDPLLEADWLTVDEVRADGDLPIVLIDCLTLWLTNVMLGPPEADDITIGSACDRLCARLAARAGPVIAVSNEVGDGIVPTTPLGRRFRDHQGRLNQDVGRIATDVVRLVAGCPLVVKPAPVPDISL